MTTSQRSMKDVVRAPDHPQPKKGGGNRSPEGARTTKGQARAADHQPVRARALAATPRPSHRRQRRPIIRTLHSSHPRQPDPWRLRDPLPWLHQHHYLWYDTSRQKRRLVVSWWTGLWDLSQSRTRCGDRRSPSRS